MCGNTALHIGWKAQIGEKDKQKAAVFERKDLSFISGERKEKQEEKCVLSSVLKKIFI